MAKATTTIRQALNYQPAHSPYIASTQDLFTQVTAFYFEVIALHEQILALSNKEALTAMEKLTNTTKDNPRPVMPLSCALC
jgi:putative transposase